MTSNVNGRSNSSAVSVTHSTGKYSSQLGTLTLPPKTAELMPNLEGASSALFGLLTQPQTVRTLSPFPKPSLSTALETARCGPSEQPRRAVPIQNKGQTNHKATAYVNPALVSAVVSSAAKDAIAKYGQNNASAKPSNAVAQGKGKNYSTDKDLAQGKGKNYSTDKDFKSKAKPVASSVSTRPKRGKQRRNFSDLLQDDSEEESSEVRESV